MEFSIAPAVGSHLDPGDTNSGLAIEGPRGECITTPSQSQALAREGIQKASSTLSLPVHISTDGNLDERCLSLPTADMLTAHDFSINVSPLADHLLHFDATNWLLDENFVDVGGGDFNWNEPHDIHDQPSSGLSHLPFARENNNSPAVLDLGPVWYVQVHSTVHDIPDDSHGVGRQVINAMRGEIDEIYRTNMDEELRAPLRNDPLPSIDFLNLCIHLFFTRSNIALPLIHGPTFKPSVNNILVVLTMCCTGAMTMMSDKATRIGLTLFERIIKSGNGRSWEKRLSGEPHLMRETIKGAIIGQNFAILSSDPAHRTIADAYLGSLISLGRHVKLFAEFPEVDVPDTISPEELLKAWKQWVLHEEMKRAAVTLHIHDAEIAALFHHEPIFRHPARRLPIIAPADLFRAPTATIWATKYRAYRKSQQQQAGLQPNEASLGSHERVRPQNCGFEGNISNPSMFNSWAALSGIGASISESRGLNLLSSQRIIDLEADLVRWYSSNTNCCRAQHCWKGKQPELPFCLKPLWHHTFMTLAVDLDLLGLASGRQGSKISATIQAQVGAWISSADSKRCLLHALCLQTLVASTTIDSAVANHTARILFSVALCWYCYLLYLPWSTASSPSNASMSLDETFEYLMGLPEFRLLREERCPSGPFPNILGQAISDLKRILRANTAEMKASTLCVLESTLRRLGTNGISRQFADIIQAFVTGETQ
ncbi:uncharacterized protein Z519_12793 [Cladophialophora bantiana CBS 173.52]|uniref:Transcription factor domain-containing protein n=1 Tax=Cladophialophora bantiana (strain ATCC 10958 / CBS 173.52 / CDC B-1940 / NIH 8579) TaxID=1442370 RepID=A0A0D2HQ91_CLAB1|nr:uncharacterized protein Z519_12793 [Cladophialophora bantiana CBS 173.52]KIW86609.1 hypothetical protein Z519_12793 [Cladophialophora bantiana CBS 173.52]